MAIKRYSDFESFRDEKKSTPIENVEEQDVEEQVIEEQVEEEKQIKEDILIKTGNISDIEILEENIIKFNTGHLKDILETIKTKYSDTDYFFRKKDNQLHVVKYNEKIKLNINEFVNSLLKYYSTNNNFKKILEGIKVKGNQSFSIIENMKSEYNTKFVEDLTKLLSKKQK